MENKNNKKVILSFIILLLIILGLIGYIVYDKVLSNNDNDIKENDNQDLIDEINEVVEIYKKDNDYKVYLKSNDNKEIDGYKLYKTFGINDDKMESFGYYIIDNEYLVGYDGAGQMGYRLEFIIDINKDKVIIENMQTLKFYQGYVRLIKSNGTEYFYVSSASEPGSYRFRVYDVNGNYLSEHLPNEVAFKGKKCELLNGDFTTSKECDGYYRILGNQIGEFKFDGTVVKSTKEYDDVLAIGNGYSLVYQKSDNSVYIIKNDDTFMKRVDVKKDGIYRMIFNDNNTITIENGTTDGEYFDSKISYQFNILTSEVKLLEN